MPIDPVIQAQMKNLIMREKELEKEKVQLEKDIPVWLKRVDLATSKGMSDLARQAGEKADELKDRYGKLKVELEVIDQEKGMLRYQAKRPSGVEVQRSEMMLEEVRLGGLVDPDRAQMERELDELVEFDFDSDDK